MHLKTNTVVFFTLKEDCKYYDSENNEVTTEMVMKYPHVIEGGEGYLVIE